MITIKEAANLASVSEATIRNWIKTNYLIKNKNGISKESFDKLLKEIIGNEKLTSRANKSQKDSYNIEELNEWIEKNLSKIDIEKLAIEYEKKLSNSYKNKEGIYYTPEYIIENMFNNIPMNENTTFLDPACGSGNFIMKAIEKGIKPENIYGFDTDINAIKITKERIYQKTGYKTDKIKHTNFLEYVMENDIKFDLIFTNPPWGKKIKKNEKEKYGEFLETNSLDTTSLFLLASLKLLDKNGFLGFLVQDAFFNIANFEDVRKKILNYNILKIIDYDKAFDGLVNKAQAIIIANNQNNNIIKSEINNKTHILNKDIFKKNPKTIFNFWIKKEESKVIDTIFQKNHKTLKNNAKWGLGIVTGNNKKHCINSEKKGYIPVYKGSDITPTKLKSPSCYIPDDFSLYQQVAPIELYKAKEKVIYRFISSKLIFYYDTNQSFILNSANLVIPNKALINPKQLADLFNSNIMNWLFSKIFNTHKILRGDLEYLPIHIDYFNKYPQFNENTYLEFLNIKEENGTYRIKK